MAKSGDQGLGARDSGKQNGVNQGLGFGEWGKQNCRNSQLAVLAFTALSIPLALVPSQIQCLPGLKPLSYLAENGTAEAVPLQRTVTTQAGSESSAGVAVPVETTALRSERKIVVSIPDRKLAIVEGGRVKKVYRVAVGARWSPSPAGNF